MREQPVTDFRKEHEAEWIFLQWDKNMGRIMALCPCLYYDRIAQLYDDEDQFETISEHASPEEAAAAALALLAESATHYKVRDIGGRARKNQHQYCLYCRKTSQLSLKIN